MRLLWKLTLCGATLFLLSSSARGDSYRPLVEQFSYSQKSASPMTNNVRDVIFLGQEKPILIRLHLNVDGKPHHKVWHRFFESLFQELDKDNNGMVSRHEHRKVLPVPVLFSPNPAVQSAPTPEHPGNWEQAKLAQLEKNYRGLGARPFTILEGSPRKVDGSTAFRRASSTKAGQLNLSLMRLLDRNRDLKIDLREMRMAEASLLRRDFTEDERLSVGELTGKQVTPVREWYYDDWSGSQARYVSRAIAIEPGKPQLELRAMLQQVYGTEKSSLVLTKPAIELEVNLGATPSIRILKGQKGRGATVHLGQTQFVLQCEKETKSDFQLNAKALFKKLDKDGNNYVDVRELLNDGRMYRSFYQIDKDSNAKLFPDEIEAYCKQLQHRKRQMFGSIVQMEVQGKDQGLFGVLDADQDGELTVREMRRLPAIVGELDRNNDSRLTLSELPSQFRLRFSLASPVDRPAPENQKSQKSANASFPVWFGTMDRNQDGEVSQREFVGSRKVFEKIDLDHDGFLSAAEAKKADQAFRRTRRKP